MEPPSTPAILVALAAINGHQEPFQSVPPPDPGTAEDRPEVRIGYLSIAAQLPLFVAVERGFFKDEGVRYRLVAFASSDELVDAAAAGRVDVLAGAALNVVFEAAAASGQHPMLFALNPYSDRPGHVTDHLVVRKASGVRTVAQLRGKRVANFPGSVQGFLHRGLERYGLPPTAYETVEMRPEDWQSSLASGTVDAVAALEPYASQMMADGVGVSLVPGFLAKLMPEVPVSGQWLAAGYVAQADPAQVHAVVRAYERAVEFCRRQGADAKPYLVKYARVRPDVVSRVNLNPWRMTSPADTASLVRYARMLPGNRPESGSEVMGYLFSGYQGSYAGAR